MCKSWMFWRGWQVQNRRAESWWRSLALSENHEHWGRSYRFSCSARVSPLLSARLYPSSPSPVHARKFVNNFAWMTAELAWFVFIHFVFLLCKKQSVDSCLSFRVEADIRTEKKMIQQSLLCKNSLFRNFDTGPRTGDWSVHSDSDLCLRIRWQHCAVDYCAEGQVVPHPVQRPAAVSQRRRLARLCRQHACDWWVHEYMPVCDWWLVRACLCEYMPVIGDWWVHACVSTCLWLVSTCLIGDWWVHACDWWVPTPIQWTTSSAGAGQAQFNSQVEPPPPPLDFFTSLFGSLTVKNQEWGSTYERSNIANGHWQPFVTWRSQRAVPQPIAIFAKHFFAFFQMPRRFYGLTSFPVEAWP